MPFTNYFGDTKLYYELLVAISTKELYFYNIPCISIKVQVTIIPHLLERTV